MDSINGILYYTGRRRNRSPASDSGVPISDPSFQRVKRAGTVLWDIDSPRRSDTTWEGGTPRPQPSGSLETEIIKSPRILTEYLLLAHEAVAATSGSQEASSFEGTISQNLSETQMPTAGNREVHITSRRFTDEDQDAALDDEGAVVGDRSVVLNDSAGMVSDLETNPSYAESVFSRALTAESAATGYSKEAVQSASQELVRFFLSDEELCPLFAAGLADPAISRDRLERNFRRFLVKCSIELTAITDVRIY